MAIGAIVATVSGTTKCKRFIINKIVKIVKKH